MCALEARIAALPEAEALAALTEEDKEALAAELEALVEAYDALTAEEQGMVSNIGRLMEVYQTFQGMMVMTTEEEWGEDPHAYVRMQDNLDYELVVNSMDPIPFVVLLADIPESAVKRVTFTVYYKTVNNAITTKVGEKVIARDSNGALPEMKYDFTPEKAGSYSVNLLMETSNGEFQDTLSLLVEVGLRIDYVELDPYYIQLGVGGTQEITFTPHLVGDGTLDHFEYVMGTIDANGQWNAIEGFEPFKSDNMEPYIYTVTAPGTYCCQVTLYTAEGAQWTEWSNHSHVLQDETIGQVVRLYKNGRGDHVSAGATEGFEMYTGDVEVASIEWTLHRRTNNDSFETVQTTGAGENRVEFKLEQYGDYVVSAVMTAADGTQYTSKTYENFFVIQGGFIQAGDAPEILEGDADQPVVGSTVKLRPVYTSGTPEKVIAEVWDPQGERAVYEQLTGDHVFAYTFPVTGSYRIEFHAIHEYEDWNWETSSAWDFQVVDANYQRPGIWADGRDFASGEPVSIHVGVESMEGIDTIDYIFYSHSAEEDIVFEGQTEKDFVFDPPKGGQYHISADIHYTGGYSVHIDADEDIWVYAGMYPVDMTCDPENGAIPVGGSVTFTVLTEGEDAAGTATYDFRLYKPADNEEGRELVGEQLGLTSKSATFQIDEPGIYFVDVKMVNGDGCGYYTGWGEVKAGAIAYYATTAQGNYGVNDTIEVLTELESETDTFEGLRFELYRWEGDTLVKVAGPEYMTREEYLTESRRPVLVSFPAPEGGWAAGTYQAKVFVEYAGGAELENRHGWNFDVMNGSYALGLERDIEEPAWGQEITFTPIVPEGMEGKLTGVRYEIYHEDNLYKAEELNNDGTVVFTPEIRGNYTLNVTLKNENDEEMIVQDEFFVNTYPGDQWPGMWSDGDRFEGLDGTVVDIHLDIGDENGNLPEEIERVVWYVWSETLQKDLVDDNRENVLHFVPEIGGYYHVECDVFWKDGWVDHHGAADFEVLAGLYPVGMECSPEDGAIPVGGEVVFTVNTEGEGTADYTFTLYKTTDFTPGNEKWVEYDVRTSQENSVSFTINEPGFYHVEVEVRNHEGALYHTDWGEVKAGAVAYYAATSLGNCGVNDTIEVLTELENEDDPFVRLRFELYRVENDEAVLVAGPQYMTRDEYLAEGRRPVLVSFPAPEGGWAAGTYQPKVYVEYADGTSLPNRHGWMLDVVNGSYALGLERDIEEPAWGQEITFTPIVPEGMEGKLTGVRYEIYHEGDLHKAEELNNDGTVVFTPEIRGNYTLYVTLRNEMGEEMIVQDDFFVNTYPGDQWPGMWSDGDRFEGLDGTVVDIHLDIGDENGNLPEEIEKVVWYVSSETLQEDLVFERRENVLHFVPEIGGYYHVECDVLWKDGWVDHHGAADFEVLAGLYPVGMDWSAEYVRTGESVTFTVQTAGEGKAQYEYQLYKLVFTNAMADSVPYGDAVVTDSSSHTFQLEDAGYYYCDVKMVNDQGAVYYTSSGDVGAMPGMYISGLEIDGPDAHAPNEDFRILAGLTGEGTFKRVWFELYRWEDDTRSPVLDTKEVTWEEYQALGEQKIAAVFEAPETGWDVGSYNIAAFIEYEDGGFVRYLMTWNVDVLSGRRITAMTISEENPVVGETVTVTPTLAGDGSITSIRYELYHDGNLQKELEGDENGFSFQAKWGGTYEVNAFYTNDQNEEGYCYTSCQALGIYLDPVFQYDVADGDNFQITAQIKDEWDRVVEAPAGNLTYEYRILDTWGENVLYAEEKTGENTFTWKPTGPGTYNAEVKVYRDYDEYVLEETRTFSVGRLDVLRGMNASAAYAPVGSSVTFTPVTRCEVDSYIYRIYKRADGHMQEYHTSKETTDSSFTFVFTEPGEYACQVEVKVGGASFLDGVSLRIYEGRFATRVQVEQKTIDFGDSVRMDLETVGSGDIGTVTYRIFRDEYLAGDLEQEITVTGGETAASYVPKFGGSYWIEAEVDDGSGSYQVAENVYITVRQGRSLEGAEPMTWPIFVNEEAKFQLELAGEGEIGTIIGHLWDENGYEIETYEDIPVDENGQIALTFDRTGSFNLELWMINENGDRYLTWSGFDVHDRSEAIADWLEMYNDFGFTDAQVNTEVEYHLHVIGDEANIAKIDYFVYYCDVNDLDKCWMLEQFCQKGSTSLDFSFTPDETGYYWVGAELTDKGGNVTFAGYTECTVSETRGLEAKLSKPTVDGYAYKINDTITVTAQYEGTAPAKYRMRVTLYDRDFETGEEFYNEVVPNTKAQTSPTFKFEPAQMGYYMVEIELLDQNGAIIGHSCVYSVLVMGGDVEPAGAEPERDRYLVGEDITVNFTYKNEDLGEVTDVEFVYRWYTIDEDGNFVMENVMRQAADPADKDSFTFTPEEPGLYSVVVFIRTAQGNYMGYGTNDYIEVLPEDVSLKADTLEMIDGGAYNQAEVNSEVKFHLNTVGEGQIGKIRFEVGYCENDNFALRQLVEEFTQTGESQDFAFKPDKAGYYWVKAMLTNGEGVVSASASVKVVVSATNSVALELSEPDRADGCYSVGKVITITAKYAGTKPKNYKLTVIRDNAELETFESNDYLMKEFKAQTSPVFKYTPTATGRYQFLLEVVTADNVTLFAREVFVPVIGEDKRITAVNFEYDEYNVYDDVTVHFAYEGEGEITDMLIWVSNDTTGNRVAELYIPSPSEAEQNAFTFTPEETGSYRITVFAHNSDGNLWWLDSTGTAQVLEADAEIHWYHLETVEPKEATASEFGTKGYQYYTCSRDGHEDELFAYPDRAPMTPEDLETLEEANRIYFKGGEIEIRKVTETGSEPLNDTELVDMAMEPAMKLEGVRTPEDYTEQGVTWSSSSEAIATVDDNGNVTFLKPGTVTITATATDGGGVKQSVKFTVYFRCQATAITAKLADQTNLFGTGNPAKTGVQVGDNVNLVVTGRNDEVTVEPEYLTYKLVSGNAEVDENGVLTALGTGTAKIEISITGDPLKRKTTLSVKLVAMVPDSCEFTYTDENEGKKLVSGYIAQDGFVAEGEGIVLYASKSSTPKTFYIAAVAHREELENGILQAGQFTWKSSNKAVKVVEDKTSGYAKVTISANTAIEAGECVITATSKQNKEVTASFRVVVIDFMPKLEKTSITLNTFLANPAETIGLTSVPGNAVTDVQLQEYDAKTKAYDACTDLSAVYGNGQVTIAAEKELPNATRKLRLLAQTENGAAVTLDFTAVVKNVIPTVTVKQTVRVNLGAFDSTGTLTVTAKLGKEVVKVTNVMLKPLADGTIGYTLGSGTSDDSTYVCPVKLVDTELGTKGTLVIELEGFDKKVEKAFTAATENKVMAGTLNTYMVYDPAHAGSFVEVPLPEGMTGEVTISDADLKAVKAGNGIHIYAEDIIAKGGTRRVTVTVGDVSRTVNVTIRNVAPKITVTQTKKVNQLDKASVGMLTITAMNGAEELMLGDVTLTPTSSTAKLGYKLTRNGDVFELRHTDPMEIAATKGTLTIPVVGYHYEMVKAFTVSVEKVADKGVMSPAKVTMYQKLPGMVQNVTLDTHWESTKIDWEKTEIKAGSTTGVYAYLDVHEAGGQIQISFRENADQGTMKAGTAKYTITPYSTAGTKLANVTLTVTVSTALPKVTIKPTTVKLSKSQAVPAELTVTAAEAGTYELSRFEIDNEDFTVEKTADGKFMVAIAEGHSPVPKTYTVKLTPVYGAQDTEVSAAAVTLRITVAN